MSRTRVQVREIPPLSFVCVISRSRELVWIPLAWWFRAPARRFRAPVFLWVIMLKDFPITVSLFIILCWRILKFAPQLQWKWWLLIYFLVIARLPDTQRYSSKHYCKGIYFDLSLNSSLFYRSVVQNKVTPTWKKVNRVNTFFNKKIL